MALLLGVAFVALPPPEPVLPGGVKRIASTVAWQSNRPSAPRATYFWLSPHELLFFDVTTPGLQPVRLDTRTGARVPVRVARNTVTLVPRDWATMRFRRATASCYGWTGPDIPSSRSRWT